MAMEIVQNGPVAGKPVEAVGSLPSRASNRKVGRSTAGARSENRATIVAIHPELGRFASADDRLNAIAASARTADKRAAVVKEAVSRMQESLETITKSYPPFPPGSEERVRALKSYAALRKQIAQLTVPPEEDAAAPKENRMRAENLSTFTFVLQSDGRVRTVPREELRVGPSGLTIPEVQYTATDEEIRKAIGALEQTAAAIDDQRATTAARATAAAASELEERKGQVLRSSGISGDHALYEQAAQAISQLVREDLGGVEAGLFHTPELRYSMGGA
jgi:hypothetical protein